MKNATISSYFSYRSVSIGSLFIIVSFFVSSLQLHAGENFAVVAPPNDADRELLAGCKSLEPEKILNALCRGANKEITDERGTSPHTILNSDENDRFMQISVDATDLVRECREVLNIYPGILIGDFGRIDNNIVPSYASSLFHTDYSTYRLGNINGTDYFGDTIIHRAVRKGEEGDTIVEKLVGSYGYFKLNVAALCIQNDHGKTPLDLVFESERSEKSSGKMCSFLVSRGAPLDIKHKKGARHKK